MEEDKIQKSDDYVMVWRGSRLLGSFGRSTAQVGALHTNHSGTMAAWRLWVAEMKTFGVEVGDDAMLSLRA